LNQDVSRPRISSEMARGHIAEARIAHYLCMEELLLRTEGASSHYAILGLERDSRLDDLEPAYHGSISLLESSHKETGQPLPGPTRARIVQAIKRLSHAYSVLSNPHKRVEYDRLFSAGLDELEKIDACGPRSFTPRPHSAVRGEALQTIAPRMLIQDSAFSAIFDRETYPAHTALDQESLENRRKFDRFKLSIPAYVTGYDRSAAEWHEMTYTIDVSRLGVMLFMRKKVRRRSVVHLALPLPMSLRCHRHSEPSYSVYAIVRRVEPPIDGLSVVALEFIGEHPPKGYLEKPWRTYGTKWNGSERRRAAREGVSETVFVDYFDRGMHRIKQETAVTEDLSDDGMRVFVKAAPPELEIISVTSPMRNFERLGALRNRYVGKDGFERLCLQFMNYE
jgi:hypothetical protein